MPVAYVKTATGYVAIGSLIATDADVPVSAATAALDMVSDASPAVASVEDVFAEINTWLRLKPIDEVSTGTTLTSAHYTLLVDASGGAITVTLPAAASHTGRRYYIKKIDSSANAVTVDGNASETIDGATTATLPSQYDSIGIQCDGTTWWIL